MQLQCSHLEREQMFPAAVPPHRTQHTTPFSSAAPALESWIKFGPKYAHIHLKTPGRNTISILESMGPRQSGDVQNLVMKTVETGFPFPFSSSLAGKELV